MRILLISANTEPFPEPVFPLGAVYVGNALQKAGAVVRIFDMRHCSCISSLNKELAVFRPDYIGISLRNIDNAAYPSFRFYLPAYALLLKALRASCAAPIILGGSAFSLFPEEILNYLDADGGIVGEGENAIDLFKSLKQGKIMTPAPLDIDDTSFPDNIDKLFPRFNKYRTVGIQTARGCSNHCIYCTYPYLEGRKIRTRSPEEVSREIAMLNQDFGIRNFFLVNSLLNADENHMIRVLEKIAALKIPMRISCYLQPKIYDPDIFRLMKKAGCVAVDFGTDSGSSGMLSNLKKPFTKDDIRKSSRACQISGIDFCHSLIFGGPGETFETIHETIGLMDEVSPKAVIPMTGIRIYPGTELMRIAIEEGNIVPGESLLKPRFYFPCMGSSALLNFVYESTAGRRNWFFPGKKDWSSTVGFKLLNFLYRKGPLWRTLFK